MKNKTTVVSEFNGFQIVEIADQGFGARRFFGQKDGVSITKGYISADAVRTELEMQYARQSVSSEKWVAAPELVALAPGALVTYPLGRVLLLVLTLGRYPKEKHNKVFVAFFPGIFLLVFFALLAVVYS
ncbi:hypothetical protein [Oryzomicrobium sp.]|uniref:hypothetical protein n=1 Tax=Oryzomicrobium sp. TaxID=1911578 RepID=UPI0025FDB511|nr:hypothetical protein [Oryzomicrobium sp.]MCE1243962.1 hypothetical protein [Oryzomicrobium sp.]